MRAFVVLLGAHAFNATGLAHRLGPTVMLPAVPPKPQRALLFGSMWLSSASAMVISSKGLCYEPRVEVMNASGTCLRDHLRCQLVARARSDQFADTGRVVPGVPVMVADRNE